MSVVGGLAMVPGVCESTSGRGNGQVRFGLLTPCMTAVRRALDTFGPTTATTVRPALDLNLAVVDDDLLGPRGHNGGGDGHFLDIDAVGGKLVVFADLAIEVEVLSCYISTYVLSLYTKVGTRLL